MKSQRRDIVDGAPTIRRGASRSISWLIPVLIMLSAAGPLVIGIHTPLAENMANDLGTTAGEIQLTLTTYLLGIAVGQVTFGPLSDRFGRRRPLLIGNVTASVLCLTCAMTTSVQVLALLRFGLGLCFSVGMVLASAIGADLTQGRTTLRLFTGLTLAGTVLPLLSPALGTLTSDVLGWRGMFIALAILAAGLAALVSYGIPESLSSQHQLGDQRGSFGKALGKLLKNRRYLGFGTVRVLTFSSVIGYVSAMPLVLEELLQVDQLIYLLVIIGSALGFGIAMLVADQLTIRFTASMLIFWGCFATAITSLLLLILLATGVASAALSVGLLMAVITSLGLAVGNSSGLTIDAARETAGTGSAIVGCAMFLIGAVLPPLFALDSRKVLVILAVLIASCAVIASTVAFQLRRE